MKHQAIRSVAMMLSVLLVMAMPVHAGSIQFGDVVQTIVDGQNGRSRMNLRLRNISQSGRLPIVGGTSSNSGGSSEGTQSGSPSGGGSNVSGGDVNSSSVVVEAAPAQGPSGQVQTVDLGDVTGTVCDCGEIPVPAIKRGFPLWPLLAGIPLICVTGICSDDGDRTNPVCVVNCGETVIPEPATLLLFGSGLLALGARARRRRRPEDSVEETAATTTGAQV